MQEENKSAWNLWQKLNSFDRQYGAMGGIFKITTMAASNLCETYRECIETFEKIMTIEELMYPSLLKQMSDNADKKDKAE